jgi:riboflavin kinase / FMN adenylyltransferase
MQILHDIEGLLKLPKRSVLSIGNFDGVHLGHQRILQTARQLASANACEVAVVTFEPHPMTALRPEFAPPRLTPPAIKQPLLEAAGADYLVILPPEKQVLNLTAENFWHMLRDDVRAAHLVEGSTFRFGKGAQGTVEKLREWSVQSPVSLHVVESVHEPILNLQIVPVSSSVIRFLLQFGRVRDAAICLGRPYVLSGSVGKGFSRGKSLGVPTANLKCDDQLVPADAVYAGRCKVGTETYPAAVSIGTMPTFGEHMRQIEAHLVGFDGDLYGQTLYIELLDWIREQRKFAGAELLKAQMARDISRTSAGVTDEVTRPIALQCI